MNYSFKSRPTIGRLHSVMHAKVVLYWNVYKELSLSVSQSRAVPTTRLKSTLPHSLTFPTVVSTSCSVFCQLSALSSFQQRKHLSRAEL